MFPLLALGCNGGGGGGGSSGLINTNTFNPHALQAVSCPAPPTGTIVSDAGTNVLTVAVGDTITHPLCTFNVPCTSVKICQPGSVVNCQTLNNILVDTGSFGLRIFSSAITGFSTNLLTPTTDGSGHPLASCAEFGSGNAWGSVVKADVTLGGEPALSSLNIQLINTGFSTIPATSGCTTSLMTAPGQPDTPFNGILGVGLEPLDTYSEYFSCNGGTCSPFNANSTQQVPNPVAKLGTDNNGVILDMPALTNDQEPVAFGALILGIGTGAHGGNNTPGAVTTYTANSFDLFTTTIGGYRLAESFIDSGSNFLFFPAYGLQTCNGSDVLCLSQSQCFQATDTSAAGVVSPPITFRIMPEFNVINNACDAVGVTTSNTSPADTFDWGLPFFYGRKVYVGIRGVSSTLGTGPYWAF